MLLATALVLGISQLLGMPSAPGLSQTTAHGGDATLELPADCERAERLLHREGQARLLGLVKSPSGRPRAALWLYDTASASWQRAQSTDSLDALLAAELRLSKRVEGLLDDGPFSRVELPPNDEILFAADGRAYLQLGAVLRGRDLGATVPAERFGGVARIGEAFYRLDLATQKIRVWDWQLAAQEADFGTANTIVLVLYLALLVAIGAWSSRRSRSTEGFFLAGRRIPWWAAGISIYATQLSAITFLATPAVSYAGDWIVAAGTMMILVMAPIVVVFYLPFYRRLGLTTAYEYLERRFSLAVRLFGSASFIAFQFGRMAVVVYLPALALSAVTGIGVHVCIIVMGVLATVYTVLGGMTAVIWTDVAQTFVLLGGMLAALVMVIVDVGGIAPALEAAETHGKLRAFDWSFSSTELVSGSILLGSLLLQFGPYTTDQAVVQRYLTTKDEKAAARGIWLNGILAVPFALVFYALGTALWTWFRQHPDELLAGMANDQVVPLFVARAMPAGLAGLVIAGVFAASMSSLDSSMHSISTAVTTDWYRRLGREHDEAASLRFAKRVTVLCGAIGTGLALVLAGFDIESLFFLFQKILGLLSSGLVAIFVLGIFSRRASSRGVLVGAALSFAALVPVVFFSPLHFYLYPVVGIGVGLLGGWAASFALPDEERSLEGLVWGSQPE